VPACLPSVSIEGYPKRQGIETSSDWERQNVEMVFFSSYLFSLSPSDRQREVKGGAPVILSLSAEKFKTG